MASSKDFKRIDKYVYECPAGYQRDMHIPARFYADPQLLAAIEGDKSLEQLVNTATLPGAVRHALAMPDIHQGYGFPIGGVVATQCPDGIISPGGVGYDINCGVRLLATHLDKEQVQPHLDDLASSLYANCPSGVGRGGHIKLKANELDHILETGSRWTLKRGLASEEDLERTEEGGFLEGADASKVSSRAKQRGQDQVGTLGAGNHFIEADVVDHVYEEPAAQASGLQRLCQSVSEKRPEIWLPAAGPRTGLRAVEQSGRAGLSGGDESGGQLRLCQSPGADALYPAQCRGRPRGQSEEFSRIPDL